MNNIVREYTFKKEKARGCAAQGTKKCKGDYLVTREIIESARGRETSQISMIKVRGRHNAWREREREGIGGSGKEWEG